MLDRKLSLKHSVRLYLAIVVVGYVLITGVVTMSNFILPLLME